MPIGEDNVRAMIFEVDRIRYAERAQRREGAIAKTEEAKEMSKD